MTEFEPLMGEPDPAPRSIWMTRRPGKDLRPDDLPNLLLEHFDRVWSQRTTFNLVVPVSSSVLRADGLDEMVETRLTKLLADELVRKQRTMVASTGVRWFVRPRGPATVLAAPERLPADMEVPRRELGLWEVREPAFVPFARVSGVSVPAYTGEPPW